MRVLEKEVRELQLSEMMLFASPLYYQSVSANARACVFGHVRSGPYGVPQALSEGLRVYSK